MPDIDLFQPRHGFQKDAAIADRQIRPFHQGEVQILRKIRVFEVSLVVRSWRKQDDARIVHPGKTCKSVALRAKERCQPKHA